MWVSESAALHCVVVRFGAVCARARRQHVNYSRLTDEPIDPSTHQRLVVCNCPHPLAFLENGTFKQLMRSWYFYVWQWCVQRWINWWFDRSISRSKFWVRWCGAYINQSVGGHAPMRPNKSPNRDAGNPQATIHTHTHGTRQVMLVVRTTIRSPASGSSRPSPQRAPCRSCRRSPRSPRGRTSR